MEPIVNLFRACINKRTDILSPNPMKSRNHEIGCYKDRILILDIHHGNNAAEVPVKFQSDKQSVNPNATASGLLEILRQYVRPLNE